MTKPGYTGLKRIVMAAGYSLQGFRAAWKHESAFRQETLLTLAFLPLAIWLGQSAAQTALLISTLFLSSSSSCLTRGSRPSSTASILKFAWTFARNSSLSRPFRSFTTRL